MSRLPAATQSISALFGTILSSTHRKTYRDFYFLLDSSYELVKWSGRLTWVSYAKFRNNLFQLENTMQISNLSVSSSDTQKINAILKKNFPQTSVQVSGDGTVGTLNACTDACNIAQAIAEAACEEIGGIGAVICKLAVKAAGDECRRHC